eukprot:SAG31_NODE_3136_length_4636_cov_1.969583_4_plen_522_part_01
MRPSSRHIIFCIFLCCHSARCRLGDTVVPLLEALASNVHLTNLNLSRNELGSPAVSKTIANLFRQNQTISTLHLGWNQLRNHKFDWVARALTDNIALTTIDLSWNALGDVGGALIGSALRKQRSVLNLDLSNNDIAESGATVLADALKENYTLERVNLDHNPIGQRGGRAMLRAIRQIIIFKYDANISMCSCNFDHKDPAAKLFDPQEPGGQHTCDLADIHQRVKANELIELAWREEGENVKGEKLNGKKYDLPEPPDGVVWTREDFNLPESGTLELFYVSTRRPPRMEDVIEDEAIEVLLDMMQDKQLLDKGLALLHLASQEWFFTSYQVGQIVLLYRDPLIRVDVVKSLLGRTVDCVNWNRGFFNKLSDKELRMLEAKIGQLYFFVPCNPTGHYRLELAVKTERQIANRLVAACLEERRVRREKGLIDTSEHGGQYTWRNVQFNGKPWRFDERDLMIKRGLPTAGVLEFDYVSTSCAHRIAKLPPSSDADYQRLLTAIHDVHKTVLPPKEHEKPVIESKP